MGPDAPPDDVRLAFSDRVAVLKRDPSVVIPGQLEDACGSLDAFDSETLAKTTAALKILDKLSDRGQKSCLLSRCESTVCMYTRKVGVTVGSVATERASVRLWHLGDADALFGSIDLVLASLAPDACQRIAERRGATPCVSPVIQCDHE
jgi:hypothetical protein